MADPVIARRGGGAQIKKKITHHSCGRQPLEGSPGKIWNLRLHIVRSRAYFGPNIVFFCVFWNPEQRGGGEPAAPPSGSTTAFVSIAYTKILQRFKAQDPANQWLILALIIFQTLMNLSKNSACSPVLIEQPNGKVTCLLLQYQPSDATYNQC